MRDDVTPTESQPADTLGAQLESFRANPSQGDLFRELRKSLRKSGQLAELAELAALHAARLDDPLRAASVWADAGEAQLELRRTDEAEGSLRTALALDPGHERAARHLFELLVAAGRHAEAAEIAERELASVGERADAGANGATARRRADRHRAVARLWQRELGRVDRALHHWQRAWQLEPSDPEPLEASRALYASLGDERMVVTLYQTELEILGDGAPERAARLELELGRLQHRLGESEAAAAHLERALERSPEALDVREALAEVYASVAFAGDVDKQRRASELFVELGRQRMASEERDAAIKYLRRALGVDPYSRAGTDSLEDALARSERWEELDRLYQSRGALSDSDEERTSLLLRRAELYEKHLGDREGLKRCLAELASQHPVGSPYARRLRRLYEEDGDWKHLVAVIEGELAGLGEHQADLQISELLELATVFREHLGDRDRAAECLHRVLTLDPLSEEALARYADHFRERRDWRGLADLHEFAIEQLRDAQAPVADVMRRLEEVAQLCELRLGDIERAITTWRRIDELEPGSPKAAEALRRLSSRAKMWESLVGVLEQEAQGAQTPDARAEALRRIAQVYRERQVNPRRAISLYEEILTLFPDDQAALKALSELYEREGDDAGLAHTIRRQLDLDLRRMVAEGQISSERAVTAREWPVAKRVERLTALRRLASMYEQRLADVDGVVFACSGILEILPGDRDALGRMERVLDEAGDLERLEQTLEYHVASSSAPAERAKVLRRLAALASDRGDELVAMERWEAVLDAAPNDAEALHGLAALYERHDRWGELAEVLERALLSKPPPEPGSPEAAERSAQLKRYARVVDERLDDPIRGVRAWQRVLEVSSRDRDALAALTRLHERNGQWRELADVLARQVPLYAGDEPERAAELALRRAELLGERLGAPAETIVALEELIRDVDPSNLPAHKRLRRLYETRGDFEAAIRIAEREMFLASEPQEKIARGLEIGMLCRDRLGDAPRALQAFERVLELDDAHEEALGAAAELYASVGDWPRHVGALERRLARASGGRDERALMLRIAQATAERLGDLEGAFRWYRKAHERAPDATTIAELRRAAESYGLWRELAEVYADERDALRDADGAVTDEDAFVAACRELAAIAERRLSDPEAAMDAVRAALTVRPQSDELLSEAERIASEHDRAPLWQALLACVDLVLSATSRDKRVALYLRRARVREDHLQDAEGATEELLRAFSWAPEREDVRQALYDLGERARSWQAALSAESALAERAPTAERRVEILRRKAAVLEERAGEPVRAFRVHLSAFLLDPEDDETVRHLWRLARDIGSYTGDQRTPTPEPPSAHIEPAAALPAPRALTPRHHVESSKPRREATQELSLRDLVAVADPKRAADAPAPEPTQNLDVSDLIAVEPRRDATMELRTEDLIEALGAKASANPAPPPPRPAAQGGAHAPPPPPPRRPQIQKQPPGVASAAPRPVAAARSRPARQTRAPIPTMPSRAYSSPWSELAAAYALLPAPDAQTRARWQFRAAEVWESGAGDVPRAFDALARALDEAPAAAEARDRLHRLAADHGEWERLAELYEAAAEEADSATAAADLLMEVAAIRTEQGRPQETESLYRRVLGIRPDDGEARQRLEDLYRREGRWVDLAASLEERTDPRLGSAAPLAERPALLRELADLYQSRLSRPHDAIDALVRLRELTPEDAALLSDLADLYGQIGRWSKVIEALTRLSDAAADDSEEAREALRRIAHIYETELELPDRAIDAYSQLIAHWPQDDDAFAALDRLYEQHARWRELEDVLRRRAALVREPAERALLSRRRASILLDWLDAPEEAATALRHARTILPDDPALADALVVALTRAGREREAAAVLEGRIDHLRAAGASAGDLAALLIRLAGLRADHLRDPHGARAVIEEALALVPKHPTALATLARLADSQKDPRAYAEARLREADAVDDVDSKIEALMAAGAALRSAGDTAAARDAFERVLELRPFQADATWSLASLVEETGDVDEAIRLLEARLDAASITSTERAQVLTQLAALSRQAGVVAAAERRLEEALETAPDHLPAILGLADLLAIAERWQELERFLGEVVPRLEDEDAATRSELRRRLAIAYEGLERADDAYHTLIEADRLHRNNLQVKLALGENRYRARRWREAALHLGSLADHPEADRHPAEVAQGLYHAALAEIRSLRPDKAEKLYERALELKGNFAPALHALAEIAMERGDVSRAADLLTRQAMATEKASERLRLFEALGDMCSQQLGDDERARVCYEAAVNAAQPLESRHLPLLDKLYAREQRLGDDAGAGRTAELLASFASGAEDRAGRLVAAADHYRNAGLADQAREAASRAVDASPYDITAVTIASELAMDESRFEDIAAMLGRALHNRDPGDEITTMRQALLWARLGRARAERGDRVGAVSACEQALELAPDSDGALHARRTLLELWKDDDDPDGRLLEFRRLLAADTMDVADVLGYARALCARGHGDGGRAALELAAVLGHQHDERDVAFLGAHPARLMAEDEAYRGSIDGDARDELLCDPDDLPLSQVCATLWDAAPLLWSDTEAAFERCGVRGAERVRSTSAIPAATIFPRIARALDTPATVLYATEAEGAPDVQVVCVSPPVVVLGPNLVSGDGPSDLALRFLLARAAELARPERIVAAGLPLAELGAILASLYRVFGDADPGTAGVDDDTRRRDEVLRKTLPVRVRSELERQLRGAGRPSPERYLRACHRAADRAGLLICGDLDTARRTATSPLGDESPSTRHLEELVLRRGYLRARARLGVGA